MHAHAEEFYDTLQGRSGPGEALSWLSAGELDRLKASQTAHLRAVLDPSFDRGRQCARSREVRRVHATCRIDVEWHVEAQSVVHSAALVARGENAHREARERLATLMVEG